MQLEQYGVHDEIWDDQLVTDDDGAFELIVSGERPPGYGGNWLRLHPNTGNITVRAYYNDWSRETSAPRTCRHKSQLVKFDQIRNVLASTPAMTTDQRRAQVAIRQAHVATRFRH